MASTETLSTSKLPFCIRTFDWKHVSFHRKSHQPAQLVLLLPDPACCTKQAGVSPPEWGLSDTSPVLPVSPAAHPLNMCCPQQIPETNRVCVTLCIFHCYIGGYFLKYGLLDNLHITSAA